MVYGIITMDINIQHYYIIIHYGMFVMIYHNA